MRAVFGHPFSLLWFSPFSTPDHGKAETYQYVVWGLSAGSEVAGSEPKWEGRPSAIELSYGSPLAPAARHHLHCISHTSHGQLFMCFFCCQLSALSIYFCVALSESSCREKETLWFCDSCLQTLWWIRWFFFLISFSFCCIFSLALCYLLLVLEGSVQLNSKKKKTCPIFLVVSGPADRLLTLYLSTNMQK